ncbi:MAG: HNH endonuclease [Alphaproteobacteria bacterium]
MGAQSAWGQVRFLDVHHKHHLEEGIRYTLTADFSLLCPACNRVEDLRLQSTRNPKST